MKKVSKILASFIMLTLLTALLSTIPVSASLYSPPDLLMTEFSLNPKGVDFQGEYFEIYNCSDKPIDLKEYKLAYTNSSYTDLIICFNEITKYAASDIATGLVEPEKAFIEPGETAVIWNKGNSGTSNSSERTSDDFLTHYLKIPGDLNLFIAEHNVTSGSEFVSGGNFYMLNQSGDVIIYLYLVRAEATVENYQEHIITGFESEVAEFAQDAYVQLQFDGETGLTKVFEIVTGDRIMVYDYIGAIMPEQDPFFDPSTTTEEESTTPPPDTTTPEDTTTDAPDTDAPTAEDTTTIAPNDDTEPPKKNKSCGSAIGFGAFLLLAPAALILKKKKK